LLLDALISNKLFIFLGFGFAVDTAADGGSRAIGGLLIILIFYKCVLTLGMISMFTYEMDFSDTRATRSVFGIDVSHEVVLGTTKEPAILFTRSSFALRGGIPLERRTVASCSGLGFVALIVLFVILIFTFSLIDSL
jgi:hypothetical protein